MSTAPFGKTFQQVDAFVENQKELVCGAPGADANELSTPCGSYPLERALEDVYTHFYNFKRGQQILPMQLPFSLKMVPALYEIAMLQLRLTSRIVAAVATRPVVTMYELEQELMVYEKVTRFSDLGLGPSLASLPLVQQMFRLQPRSFTYQPPRRHPHASTPPLCAALAGQSPSSVVTCYFLPVTSMDFIQFVVTDQEAQLLLHSGADASDLVNCFAKKLRCHGRKIGIHIQNLSYLLSLLRQELGKRPKVVETTLAEAVNASHGAARGGAQHTFLRALLPPLLEALDDAARVVEDGGPCPRGCPTGSLSFDVELPLEAVDFGVVPASLWRWNGVVDGPAACTPPERDTSSDSKVLRLPCSFGRPLVQCQCCSPRTETDAPPACHEDSAEVGSPSHTNSSAEAGTEISNHGKVATAQEPVPSRVLQSLEYPKVLVGAASRGRPGGAAGSAGGRGRKITTEATVCVKVESSSWAALPAEGAGASSVWPSVAFKPPAAHIAPTFATARPPTVSKALTAPGSSGAATSRGEKRGDSWALDTLTLASPIADVEKSLTSMRSVLLTARSSFHAASQLLARPHVLSVLSQILTRPEWAALLRFQAALSEHRGEQACAVRPLAEPEHHLSALCVLLRHQGQSQSGGAAGLIPFGESLIAEAFHGDSTLSGEEVALASCAVAAGSFSLEVLQILASMLVVTGPPSSSVAPLGTPRPTGKLRESFDAALQRYYGRLSHRLSGRETDRENAAVESICTSLLLCLNAVMDVAEVDMDDLSGGSGSATRPSAIPRPFADALLLPLVPTCGQPRSAATLAFLSTNSDRCLLCGTRGGLLLLHRLLGCSEEVANATSTPRKCECVITADEHPQCSVCGKRAAYTIFCIDMDLLLSGASDVDTRVLLVALSGFGFRTSFIREAFFVPAPCRGTSGAASSHCIPLIAVLHRLLGSTSGTKEGHVTRCPSGALRIEPQAGRSPAPGSVNRSPAGHPVKEGSARQGELLLFFQAVVHACRDDPALLDDRVKTTSAQASAGREPMKVDTTLFWKCLSELAWIPARTAVDEGSCTPWRSSVRLRGDPAALRRSGRALRRPRDFLARELQASPDATRRSGSPSVGIPLIAYDLFGELAEYIPLRDNGVVDAGAWANEAASAVALPAASRGVVKRIFARLKVPTELTAKVALETLAQIPRYSEVSIQQLLHLLASLARLLPPSSLRDSVAACNKADMAIFPLPQDIMHAADALRPYTSPQPPTATPPADGSDVFVVCEKALASTVCWEAVSSSDDEQQLFNRSLEPLFGRARVPQPHRKDPAHTPKGQSATAGSCDDSRSPQSPFELFVSTFCVSKRPTLACWCTAMVHCRVRHPCPSPLFLSAMLSMTEKCFSVIAVGQAELTPELQQRQIQEGWTARSRRDRLLPFLGRWCSSEDSGGLYYSSSFVFRGVFTGEVIGSGPGHSSDPASLSMKLNVWNFVRDPPPSVTWLLTILGFKPLMESAAVSVAYTTLNIVSSSQLHERIAATVPYVQHLLAERFPQLYSAARSTIETRLRNFSVVLCQSPTLHLSVWHREGERGLAPGGGDDSGRPVSQQQRQSGRCVRLGSLSYSLRIDYVESHCCLYGVDEEFSSHNGAEALAKVFFPSLHSAGESTVGKAGHGQPDDRIWAPQVTDKEYSRAKEEVTALLQWALSMQEPLQPEAAVARGYSHHHPHPGAGGARAHRNEGDQTWVTAASLARRYRDVFPQGTDAMGAVSVQAHFPETGVASFGYGTGAGPRDAPQCSGSRGAWGGGGGVLEPRGVNAVIVSQLATSNLHVDATRWSRTSSGTSFLDDDAVKRHLSIHSSESRALNLQREDATSVPIGRKRSRDVSGMAQVAEDSPRRARESTYSDEEMDGDREFGATGRGRSARRRRQRRRWSNGSDSEPRSHRDDVAENVHAASAQRLPVVNFELASGGAGNDSAAGGAYLSFAPQGGRKSLPETVHDSRTSGYSIAAERYVFDLLRTRAAQAQSSDSSLRDVKVVWLNEFGERGTPYDIVILQRTSPQERSSPAHWDTSEESGSEALNLRDYRVVRYVEVKSTCTSSRRDFEMSLRELLFAAKYGKAYRIFRVMKANEQILFSPSSLPAGEAGSTWEPSASSQLTLDKSGPTVHIIEDPITMWQRGKLTITGEVKVVVI